MKRAWNWLRCFWIGHRWDWHSFHDLRKPAVKGARVHFGKCDRCGASYDL